MCGNEYQCMTRTQHNLTLGWLILWQHIITSTCHDQWQLQPDKTGKPKQENRVSVIVLPCCCKARNKACSALMPVTAHSHCKQGCRVVDMSTVHDSCSTDVSCNQVHMPHKQSGVPNMLFDADLNLAQNRSGAGN